MSKAKMIVYTIGGLVFAGNVFGLLVSYLLPAGDPFAVTNAMLFVRNFAGALAVFPRGIPIVFSFISQGELSYYVILVWQLLAALCGLGLIRLNNIARRVLIVLCAIHVPLFFLSRIFASIAYPSASATVTPLAFWVLGVCVWLLPVIYIFLLTRPTVRAWFR